MFLALVLLIKKEKKFLCDHVCDCQFTIKSLRLILIKFKHLISNNVLFRKI